MNERLLHDLLEISSHGHITANIFCDVCGKRLEHLNETTFTDTGNGLTHRWCYVMESVVILDDDD